MSAADSGRRGDVPSVLGRITKREEMQTTLHL